MMSCMTLLKWRRIVKRILILLALISFNTYAVTPNDPLPKTVLSCGGSVITDIGGRLEGDKNFETGAHVTLKNHGVSVAYQEDTNIPAIKNSKVGDHVLVCLVFIPQHCPPGDDRGRFYTVTNLRTLESWTLPDSQHQCGGA